MLALARRRVPAGRFFRASFLSAKIPACVGVTAVGEAFIYLSDGRSAERTLSRLLRRIHGALVPGGVFLPDLAAPGRNRASGPRVFRGQADDWLIIVEAAEDCRRRLTRRIATSRKVGKAYRRSEELHRLRLCRKERGLGLLRVAGLRVRTLDAYASLPLPPRLVGYLSVKNGDRRRHRTHRSP